EGIPFSSFIRGARHLHTIYIVCSAMAHILPLIIMPDVLRKCAYFENGRLIHIVPDSFYSLFFYQLFKQFGPPFSHLRVCKVREIAITRPHLAFHQVTIRPLAKKSFFQCLFIHEIFGINFNSGINNHNDLKSEFPQLTYHMCRIGKTFMIPGKAAKAIHIIYIEMNNIARNIFFAEIVGKLPYFSFRVIAPFALVITQRPQWRKLGCSSQLDILFGYGKQFRPVDKIVIYFTALRPKAHHFGIFFSEIKKCLESVIEKNSITLSMMQSIVKWNIPVKRILFPGKSICIGSPV